MATMEAIVTGHSDGWAFAPATSGIVNTTTAVMLKAAVTAPTCNYVASLQIAHDALGGGDRTGDPRRRRGRGAVAAQAADGGEREHDVQLRCAAAWIARQPAGSRLPYRRDRRHIRKLPGFTAP